jgi:hypothetical protein
LIFRLNGPARALLTVVLIDAESLTGDRRAEPEAGDQCLADKATGPQLTRFGDKRFPA